MIKSFLNLSFLMRGMVRLFADEVLYLWDFFGGRMWCSLCDGSSISLKNFLLTLVLLTASVSSLLSSSACL